MKRLLRWILGVPSLIVLLLFALANRQKVVVSLDPITPENPLIAFQLPLWAVFFAGILLGLVAGGVATWIRQGKWRREARHLRHEVEVKEGQLKRAGKQQAQGDSLPALPPLR